MKYCPNCGARNESGATFCKKCGHKFPTEDSTSGNIVNQQEGLNNKKVEDRRYPSKKKMVMAFIPMWIIWVIIMGIFSSLSPYINIILGFIGTMAVVVYYKHNNFKHAIALLFSMFVVLGIIILSVNPLASTMTNPTKSMPGNTYSAKTINSVGHVSSPSTMVLHKNGNFYLDSNKGSYTINGHTLNLKYYYHNGTTSHAYFHFYKAKHHNKELYFKFSHYTSSDEDRQQDHDVTKQLLNRHLVYLFEKK